MKKVLLAITGIIAIVTTAILLIVCVKNDDNDSSSNLNNITIANDNDFTSNWTAKAAGEGDYESTTTFEIKNDVTVSEQKLVVASGVTLRITNADIPVEIGSSADVLGKQLILKDTTITLMEQAKLILDVNVILDGSSIISGATEGDAYFYPNLEFNDSVLLLNESTIDSTNFNSTAGVVVNGTLNLDGSNANLNSGETSPITLTEKAMVIAINDAKINGKIEGNGGFVKAGNVDYNSYLGATIGKLDESFTVIGDLDEITTAGNYIVYKKLNSNYERSSVEFGFNNHEVYDSGGTTRIIPFYDYLAKGDYYAQFNVDEGSTLELGGFTKNSNTYQANTNKFIIDGGANWDDEGGNVYFVTGDYDPYREGANPENDNRGMYINNGVEKQWPILYIRKNSTANLFGGVVIQNVDNTKSTGNGGGSYNYDYGTINVYGERESEVYYRPKLNVYGATIRFNHANGNENSIGGAAITAGYEKSLDLKEKNIYIADCDISYNSVWGSKSNDGAAIGLYKNTNLVMDDGLISHNHGSSANDADGGAIMVRDNSNLTMNGGTLSYNFVYGYGGAICIYSSDVTINSGNLIYNRASFGGGIASSGTPVEIHLGSSSNSDLYVAYNEAYKNTEIDDDTGYGGGVALGNSGDGDNYRQNEKIYIYGGLFEYNKALYGGGIASYTVNSDTGNKLYLEGGEIRNNNASNGGGLYIKSKDNNNVPLLYLSGSAKVDTSNNIQIDGNVRGQAPIEVTDTLTASGIVGLISYVDTSLYERKLFESNPNAVYFNGPERQVDKFLLDSDSHCFVESADADYIAIKESNSNKPYEVNGTKHSTLQEAVKAIGNNETGTIYVLRNVSLTENDLVTINNGKIITIESKSNADNVPYTLAISKDFDFSSQDTSNPGILRINPGCELTLNNINLDGNSSISDGFAFIYNTGTFTLGETASLNNNISNLNGGAINIQQSGSVTNIYGTIYGNKGPNGAVYATGENITINIYDTAVFENNTALSVNTTLGQAGIATEVENVGLYLGAGVTCNFDGFAGLKDAIFYAGAILNITSKASVPNDKVNVYISNQFYTTGQIIFNVDASLKNTDFANQFVFANGLENDSFTNGSNNTIIINKVVKAIFDFESDAKGKGEVNVDFLTKTELNKLASLLKIDPSLVTRQGHKLVIYMDVNSQLSLEIIASRASMAGYKITGFTFNESTHALSENVPFYEVSGKFIANWEENSYTFTFSHQDFNDVMGEMTAVTYKYTTGFEGGSRNIPSNKFYVVGYYFAGWQVVGTDKVLANGQEIKASDMLGMSEALNDSTNITLLAIWKSIFSTENVDNGYRNGKSEATAFIISDVDGLNRLSHTVSQSDILSFDGNDYYNTLDYNTLENGSLKYQPSSYEGYYFKLSADFDNTNAPFSNPIGTAQIKADYNPDTSDPEEGLVAYLTNTYPFSGTFDGNYSDLTSTYGISVNVNINVNGGDFLGLFGYTKDATIKNLKVTGSVIGQNSIAGVTGFMNDGSLTNVVNEANINSTGYNAGGIVGTFYRAYTNSTNDNLINLVNNGNVTYNGNKTTDLEYRDGWKENKVLNAIEGTRYGGIVGQMWSGRINGGYNSGNITARMAAGGIVGAMISMNDNSKDDSQINTALNIGNVTVTSGLLSDYQLEGTSFVQHNISAYAGGIAGRLFGASAITNVMNTANIEATYVGYTTNSSNISASSPLTHLVGEPTNMNAFYLGARGVGGIIGITSIEKEGSNFSGGNKSLEYAINTGHISGWSSVGGLVGLLAYSDVRYTINGGTIEAKGYHFINGQTKVKGGTQIYDPSYNYKYYNYLGAIVGMAISANIDSTNYFDGDISYVGYTDAVVKATGDEVTSMGNGASTVNANKLASKELIVGASGEKPIGLPETFFNTGWEYKTVPNTEENDYYYYPQLSALANNKILLKEVNDYKTIGELSMDGVILKSTGDSGEDVPVIPSKEITITLHLKGGVVVTQKPGTDFSDKYHTYTYNNNNTLTLKVKFNATTGSITLIDSKLLNYVGFEFGGWYKDNETFEEEFNGYLPSSNVDLYAKWNAINYNITYSGFGSYSDGDVKFDGDYVSSFTIENDTITLPTNVISGNGAFKFKRWIYSSGGEQFEATSFRINKDDNTITIFVKNLDGTIHDPITINIANLEFTLECDPVDYAINYYDAAGNKLTEEELEKYNPWYSYTIRDNVTLPLGVDRVGYRFVGWYLDQTLENEASNIVRGTIGEQNFYAKFEPLNYTLTIDLGRMGSLSGDSLKFTLNGTEYTLVIDNTTYKVDIPYGTSLAGLFAESTGLKSPEAITGYTFKYYSTSIDGDEFDPTDVTMSEKGLTLYAVYETTKYEITIDLSGVSIDGKELSLPETINGLKDLYQYKVNDKQLVLSGVEYHDNLEAALDLILGAISTENSSILNSEWNFSTWECPDSFSIYNVMGDKTDVSIKPIYLKETFTWTILDKDLQTVGTITNKDEGFTTTFNSNDIYQKFENSLVPAGYTYSGFYYLSDKNQNLIGDNLQITENRNIVVKLEPKKLPINFYDKDGKLITELEHNVYYQTEYGKLPEYSEPGYEFKGWSLEKNGSTIIQETDIVTVNNILNVNSIDVYAVFDLITYVIKFTNLQGHTINSTNSIEFNVKDDKTIDLNEIITNFQAYSGYTGYRFSCFTDGEGPTYGSSKYEIEVASNLRNITLEAHFEAVKVLVIFDALDGLFSVNVDDLNDGKFVNSIAGLKEVVNADSFETYYDTIQKVTSGTAKYFITYVDFGQRPVSPQYPTLEGYIFNKWNPDIVTITAEAKREYEAAYNANTYTISFITKNGETINPLTDIQHNQTVSETQVNFSKIKTGYHFDGWFINGTDEEFKFGDTKVTSDLTLEARWIENDYDLIITMDYDISSAKEEIVKALKKALKGLQLEASFVGNTLTVKVKYGTDLSSLNNIFAENGYPEGDNTYYFESYSNGTFTTMPAGLLEVTVNFTEAEPETVIIHYMGVKGKNISSIQTNKVSYQYNGGSYLLNNSIYEIQITGYEFNGLFSDASGWFSDATLTNQVSSFTWSDADNLPKNLYLKYEAIKLEITLTYINDSYEEDTTPLKVYYGDTLDEVITDEYRHSHPGYSLLGFSEVTNKQILADSYVFTYDMTLIYREEAVTYGIKFSYQKPNDKNIETGIFKIPYGEAIIYSEDYNEKYYDLTWYLKNDQDSELFNEATMPNLGDPEYAKYLHEDNNGKYIVLYAQYTPTKYTVNFDTMGGNELEPLTITVDDNYYKLATPTKEHYEFISYTYGDSTFNKDNLDNVTVTFNDLIKLFKEDETTITLKANYKPREYTLKLDENHSLTFNYEDQTVTIKWTDPIKEGATFLGYALNDGATAAEYLKTIPVAALLAHLDEKGIVTIYPVFSNLNQYQVMFIYETESGIKTNSYTVEHGSTLGDSLNSLLTPYRLGYNFDGWNVREDADEGQKTDIIKELSITQNTTYYAIFKEKEYTIKFNLNGGYGIASDQSKKYTETITLPTDIKKDNYTFVGFTYNNNNLYKDSVKVADLVTNNVITEITLEASYEEEVYTITFDSKGGSAVTSINVKFNHKVNKPQDPTRTGYTFDGWYTDPTDPDLTKVYDFNTAVTGDVTLYAKWVAKNVTVNFDLNYENQEARETTQIYHSYYNLEANPTREGYVFLGWFTDNTEGEEVLANTYVTNENEHTLYAHWKIDKYKVIFDSNGGTEVDQKELAYGAVIPEPTEPKRTGYTFLGWFTEATNGTQITFDNNLTVGSDDVTYYAHWKAYTYTVKYDGLAEENTIKYDEKFKITNNEVPKEGYEFIGWSTEENPLSVLYNKGEEVINLSVEYNGIVTLHPVYRSINYTITFNSNTGTGHLDNINNVTYNQNTLTLPTNTFTKYGYTFKGWSLDSNGEVVYSDNATLNNSEIINLLQNSVSNTVTLYAIFEANSYTINFAGNANDVTGETSSMDVSYDELNQKLRQNNFVRNGYSFLGWAVKVNGSDRFLYENEDLITNDLYQYVSEGKVTLYALWQLNTYTINYYDGNTLVFKDTYTVEDDDKSLYQGYSKYGYEFNGWSLDRVDGEKLENLAGKYEDLNLYALLPPKVIEITLNNGDTTTTINATYDGKYDKLKEQTKAGYDFLGWYTGDDIKITSETDVKDLNITTLYARYEAKSYEITYKNEDNEQVVTVKYDSNSKFAGAIFERKGYNLVGWKVEQKVQTRTNEDYQIDTIIDNDFLLTLTNQKVTLVPVWEAIKYTFTYDNSDQFKDVTIDGSIDLSQIKSKPIPGYDRYQFIINGKTYESVENVSVKDIVINDSVTTYEIKLESIQNEYTIKFDQSNKQLNFKYKGVITGLPQANVKEGQEFSGWYYNDTLVLNGTKISDLVANLASNNSGEYELIFTAKYDNKMIDGNKININGIGNIKALDDLKNTLRNKLDVHVDDDFSYKIEINDNNDGLKITYSARYNSDISFLNNILPSFIQYEENGVIHTLNLTDIGLSLTIQDATPSNKTISYTSSDIKVKINYDEKEDVIYPSLDENQKYMLDEAILKEKYNKVGYTIDGFYTNVNYTENSKYTFGEESGSITLYIKYRANEYTINYDGLEVTTSFTYDSTNTKIISNTPSKEGYTFINWNTKVDGSGISYNSGDLITNDVINYLSEGNTITLYPQYSINSYIVTFDSKGGSNVRSISVNYGEKITKPENDPTKLGYEFEYWYQNDENQEFDFNKTMGSEPITLYAKWKANTNNIEFYDESGSKLGTTGYTYTYGKSLGELYDYKVESHQEFIGWYYEVDEQKVYVDENTICTFITEGILKLYAEVVTKTYYINFEFNGGNGTYDKLVSYTGSSYTLPLVDDTNLTRTGYQFEGWKTSLNGDVKYLNGDTILSSALTNNSITLYACWTACPYDVILHYGEKTETIQFTYDELNAITSIEDLDWSKEGYKFAGWSLSENGEVKYQDNANTVNELYENRNLYAIFTPATYTITLDLDGGSSSTLSVQIQTGDNILTKLNNNPNKLGYTFTNWEYEGTIITENDTFNYAKDITLKANYDANPYEITIDLAGGISEGFTADKITVTYDSLYSNLPNNPTKEGYTFVGWYLGEVLITKDSIVKVTDNEKCIVAKYNKNSYNVTFNTNGGSYVEGLEVTYGEKITKPDDPNKLGYSFDGWYKDQNLEKEFNFETPMGSDSLTLYAKWKVVTYTINYDGLDGATYNDSNKTTYTVESDVTFGTPTKNGYRFVNWTLEDGKVITSTKGYTGNLTLIANFEAITYHITYDLNGGTYEGANNLTYTVESDVIFGQAQKLGYTFKGWSLEDGSSISLTEGYTKDLTVKANFEANTYHISVKGHKEIAPISVTYGSQIEGLDKLTITKVGHNFIGFTYNNLVITNGMIYNYSKDIEVEAQFSEIHYTIQFNANGGFGSVSSKNLSYNDEYVLPTTGYTKTGYKFIGWSKTNDGEVIENQVSMLSSVDNSVVTLYAIYEAIEYEISFENSSEIIKIHYGDVISNLPTLKDNPSERFLGWSYNGVEIKDGMLYGYDSDIKLTANFEEKVYYIYLDALGGSLENSVIEMSYGDLIDLSKYIPQAPAGYNFIGWDLNETTMPDYNLNVKAKYEGIKYNIYFNANGANGNMTFQQATYGEPTKLKANQFAKDGYVFIGWSLSSNGEILYKDESYVNVKVGGLTLYAVFEEATYKINYNLAGGKVTNNPTTYTISSDYVFNKPTKEGYKFVGFYTEDGKLVESTLGLSGNLYLTAKYEAITYNITYTSDLSIDINLLPKVYSKDNVVNFDSLTKLGYEFVGWYLNGKLVTSTLNMTGDIKLEARFKIIEYKITYVLNGANNHQDNPLKYTIKDELTFKAPTKAGYTFNGWYLSETDTKVESVIGKTGDLVLEARFTPEKVTVTFVDGNKEIEKVEIDYNSTISQITDPTKEGYVFNSWYLDGNKYDFSKPVTKDITLEAFYNKIALSTTIDNKVITVSSTSGKGLDPNYSLSVTKIVQELPLSNAIDLLYPLGDLVTLYDIKLLDKNGNIVDLGEDVKVTITDASLKEDVTYAIVHVTDDYLDYSSFGEYKVANNTISFVTPHFSMFGVVEVFEPINLTWLWVLIVLAVTAGFAFAIVVIVKNRKYQIKFVTNGGSLIAPMRLKEDALVELPNAINPGYRFKGWYLDEKLMKEAHFGSMPKENLTLFAKWERDMEAPKSKQ